MVTLAVDSLEHYLRPCFARPKLFEAQDALERGDLIAAGCLLREPARRFLFAQCEYHRCLPSKKSQATPRQLAKVLDNAGHCYGCSHDWLCDIIDTGNKLAHCKPVKKSLVECCISLLHNLLDLDDLTVGKWVRSMRQEKPRLAAASINGCLEKIRALWNWLAKKRFVEQFPTIENVPAPQRIPRCWLEHEMIALYQAACRIPGDVGKVPADKWWPAFLLTAWDTGERTSALLQLRWNDFDPNGGTLEAPAEIRKSGRKPMLYRLKLETVLAFEEIRHPPRSRILQWGGGEFYGQYKSLVQSAGLPTKSTSQARRKSAAHSRAISKPTEATRRTHLLTRCEGSRQGAIWIPGSQSENRITEFCFA